MVQVYSCVSFRARPGSQANEEVFSHVVREVKGNREDKLLRDVVKKQCR